MNQKYSDKTDKELAALLARKEKEAEPAFATLYDRYSAKVYVYIVRILNDKEQAEDIFQETFLRFHQNISETTPGSIIGYLITIARNLCLNAKRDTKLTVPIEKFEFAAPYRDTYEKREFLELIRMAIELVEEDLREPLILRVYQDMGYSEIAQLCDISPANARLKVFRAKQKIKSILSPYVRELYR